MKQVSRASKLNIPREIEVSLEEINLIKDKMAVKVAYATVNNEKIDKNDLDQQTINEYKYVEKVKIREDANDLIVITVVKKLGAYIIAVTEKSPAKYRGVFVNRMQNHVLDALENLLQANFKRMDCQENKISREIYQKDAIIKLKMLGYIAMLAETTNCILLRQYKQISLQIGEAINLITAWRKSDDARWKNKI